MIIMIPGVYWKLPDRFEPCQLLCLNFMMCSCFKYSIVCHELFCLGKFPPQSSSRNMKLIVMFQLGGMFKSSLSETQRNSSLSWPEISRKRESCLTERNRDGEKPALMLTEVLQLPEGELGSATKWEITQFLVLGFLASLLNNSMHVNLKHSLSSCWAHTGKNQTGEISLLIMMLCVTVENTDLLYIQAAAN